jgi:hypothetical protein
MPTGNISIGFHLQTSRATFGQAFSSSGLAGFSLGSTAASTSAARGELSAAWMGGLCYDELGALPSSFPARHTPRLPAGSLQIPQPLQTPSVPKAGRTSRIRSGPFEVYALWNASKRDAANRGISAIHDTAYELTAGREFETPSHPRPTNIAELVIGQSFLRISRRCSSISSGSHRPEDRS